MSQIPSAQTGTPADSPKTALARAVIAILILVVAAFMAAGRPLDDTATILLIGAAAVALALLFSVVERLPWGSALVNAVGSVCIGYGAFVSASQPDGGWTALALGLGSLWLAVRFGTKVRDHWRGV